MNTTVRNFKAKTWPTILLSLKQSDIAVSTHAKNKIKERHLDMNKILDALKCDEAEIIQCHKVNSFKHNKNELYVIWSIIENEPIHIILAEVAPFTCNLVTAYKPSPKYFSENGKKYNTESIICA